MTSKTSLVTAAAIAGVLLAGTAAVAANIGILNAADSSVIGDLAATDELLPTPGADTPTGTVASMETPTTSTTVVAAPLTNTAQQYDIADTGTVWVLATRSGLALDHVVAESGWNPVLTQSELRSLRVDFTNGDRIIVFTAALGDDGTVIVDVTEPSTVVAPPNAPATTTPSVATRTPTISGDDDDYDYEDHDDDHDDDHDEYEGADDDD